MKEPKVIGVQMDIIEGGFADRVWPALMYYLNQKDYRFVLFPGKILRSPVPLDYQFNRIYNFISPKSLDGLILSFGLDYYTSMEEQKQLISEFGHIPMIGMGALLPDIPCVLTDSRRAVTSMAKHLYTQHNRKKIAFISGPPGSYEAMARRDGYTDFFRESDLPYISELVVEGGDFLSYSGISGVAQLLDRGIPFDGLICSSDAQAVGAYDELLRRGFKIPQDISISGFDDIRNLESSRIGLTSIQQPLEEVCIKTVEYLDLILRGKEIPPLTKIPLNLVLRSSCGCFSEEVVPPHYDNDGESKESLHTDFPREKLQALFTQFPKKDHFLEIIEEKIIELLHSDHFDQDVLGVMTVLQQVLHEEPWHVMRPFNFQPMLALLQDWFFQLELDRTTLRNMNLFLQKVRVMVKEYKIFRDTIRTEESIKHSEIIRILSQRFIFTSDFKQVEFALRETLSHLDIKSFHLFLFEGELGKSRKLYLPLPKYSRPVISLYHNKSYQRPKRKFSTELLMNQSINKDSTLNYLVLPLFQTEELLGYMLISPGPEQGNFYINLVYLLSSVLKSVVLFKSQQDYQKRLKKTLKELEETNRKLQEQNRVDPLTGLFNRRGFYLMSENHLQLIRRMKKKVLIFYGDMDGLKTINDTWGHIVGDEAIVAVAWALEKTFRSSDLIARFGGDEFVVMTIDSSEEMLDDIHRRLEENLKIKSSQSQGYQLAVSMGHLLVDESNSHKSMDELLQIADERLYAEKQRRREKGSAPEIDQ